MLKEFLIRRSYVLVFLTAVLVCFSFVFCAMLNTDAKEKENQLAELNEYYADLVQDNEELDYLLNEADEKELFEQLARSHGYAYSDEKQYIDVTPGK